MIRWWKATVKEEKIVLLRKQIETQHIIAETTEE